MPIESSEDPRQAFSHIHAEDLLEIKKRRAKQSYETTEIDPAQPDLVGLALSGGGIRSATFCLGFLQELQRLRLLRIFDYLSTVSGGGYLGGWWSAWLSRQQEDTSKDPAFKIEDIKDPVGLLKRTLESPDPVACDFRDHLQSSVRGRNLLNVLGRTDLHQLTPRLYEPLAEELNAYINNAETSEEKWERKISLVNTFPCELRDIFPPLEQIEPERESNRDNSQKASEGSRCAWKDPIHHLRLFANYLTPRKGILSADTWRAISVITRNLILTWLILLPLLGGVMLLGQAWFFLNPASQEAFRCVGAECTTWAKQQPVLFLLIGPIAVLLISSVVMAIAWLLCNRDSSSSLDWIIQWACLFALAALLTSAVFAIPPLHDGLKNFFHLPETLRFLLPGPWHEPTPAELATYVGRLRLLTAWVLLLLISVVLMWRWGLSDNKFTDKGATPEALSSWRREVRRGRFGRAQSKLLVTTVVVAVVLLLSWVSCLFTRGGGIKLGIKIPVALLPILSAIAGSIFTAMRGAPAPTEDHEEPKQPSWISRLVFAATPPLVVSVLAVAASAIVHWLLLSLSNPDSGYQSSIYILLSAAAILSIALCMGLAIYELQGVQWSRMFQPSVRSAISIGLVIVTVSWLAQAFFRYGNTNPGALWKYLLLSSTSFAVLITAVVVGKLVLDKNATAGRSLKKRLGAAAILFIALTTVGLIIGLLIYFNTADNVYLNTAQKLAGRISRALVLTLLALAGGVILFRVLVNRIKNQTGKTQLTVRVLRNKLADRPESLWVTASVCLTLPIVIIGASHYLGFHEGAQDPGKAALTLFPLCIGLMLLFLITLRAVVIQKQLSEDGEVTAWYGGIFDWLIKRIPRANKNPQRTCQLLAVGAICLVSLLDTVRRGLSPGEFIETLASSQPNWKLMVAAFFVSLPLFGVSIFKETFFKKDDYKDFKFTKPLPRVMYTQGFLWAMATFCLVWALLAGLLLPKWITHVSHIPLTEGLTPILLPVAAACFLIVLLEFYWSEGDNLTSLLLAAFAYLAVTSIFFLQLAGAGINWYLVLGLLAAICVWVGALGWMVDPNAVSMHQFYKGRLVRAYMGASNMRRYQLGNKEITESVEYDDLPLKSLINCERGGPYHLINTTLNLSAGRDLATAQRSASSFVLTRKYCGSARTKYCLTDEYMNGQLTLGTAVAASGAAVSPSMGAKKPTSALAMLMTLLNVRLGYWAPTPNRKGWNSSQPRLWPFYLVREFLSQTNDLSDYCYLTDGGHFDNTGLYSLIERGCRFVVLVDCGADPTPPRFEDLGEAIRRCRIDFGTEINLKLEKFLQNDCATAGTCFAVGKIKFSEAHLRKLALAGKGEGYGPQRDALKREGYIVYVKPSLITNVTADVRGYARENKFFPQQPTTNQWFGEAQFESYRRLGQTCAHSAFGHIKSEGLEKGGHLSMKKIHKIFSGLYERAKKA
jgi:predicted acylesterase/phospholipase RssA